MTHQRIVAAAAAAVHARDHRHPSDAPCPGHDIEVVSFGPRNAKWFCHCHGLESELMANSQAHAAAREHHDHGHEHQPGQTPTSPPAIATMHDAAGAADAHPPYSAMQ